MGEVATEFFGRERNLGSVHAQVEYSCRQGPIHRRCIAIKIFATGFHSLSVFGRFAAKALLREFLGLLRNLVDEIHSRGFPCRSIPQSSLQNLPSLIWRKYRGLGEVRLVVGLHLDHATILVEIESLGVLAINLRVGRDGMFLNIMCESYLRGGAWFDPH